MSEQGVDPLQMMQIIAGGRGEALRQVAGALGTRAQGIGAPVAEQMSEMLFARTPEAQRRATQRLTSRQMQDQMLRQTSSSA